MAPSCSSSRRAQRSRRRRLRWGSLFAALAVFVTGCTLTWGANDAGQLGDGTTVDRDSPSPIRGGQSYDVVDGGALHSCGVRAGGKLYCWGSNSAGQLGDGTNTDSAKPVREATKGKNWVTVTAGGGVGHTCGVRADGGLHCWGSNLFGQLGAGTTSDRTTPTQIGAATDWSTVSAGVAHTCGVRGAGTLHCWGSNSFGQLGDGTTTNQTTPTQVGAATDWSAVAAGLGHTCGQRTNGDLYCWGLNTIGQLGDGTMIDRTSPVRVGAATWADVALGNFHTCGVRTDGTLSCWGNNASGMLGTGDTTSSAVPVQEATGSTNWTAVAAGAVHSCGLRTDGTLYCWGTNSSGQLGIGTTGGFQSSPVQEVTGATNWLTVSAGLEHTLGTTD